MPRYCNSTDPALTRQPILRYCQRIMTPDEQNYRPPFPDAATYLSALRLAHDAHQRAARHVRVLVRLARDAGATWTAIGRALGTSRQAAQHRYGPTLYDDNTHQ